MPYDPFREEAIDAGGMACVMYHAGCPDGFAAAWCAWTILGDGAWYVPVSYGQRPPSVPFGSRVFILDFSYPASELLALAEITGVLVTVLDHHKTAAENLEGLTAPGLEIIFDMEKSGAMLAWEYFHPFEQYSLLPPRIVEYVQDRDLWTWKLPRSRAFSAALRVETWDFAAWDALEQCLTSDIGREAFLQRGEAILAEIDSAVKSRCDKAFTARIGGHSVPCVNSPFYQSEIGDELCRRRPEAPFAAIFFMPDMTSRIYSLRSRGGFDVSAVAASFGGGGHAAAASFTVGTDTDISGPRPPKRAPVPSEGPKTDADTILGIDPAEIPF